MRTRQCAELGQKSIVGKNNAHVARDGFNNDCGDSVEIGLQIRLYTVYIIIFGDERLTGEGFRYALAVWITKRERSRSRTDQQGVMVAMIATGKLDDLRLAGIA